MSARTPPCKQSQRPTRARHREGTATAGVALHGAYDQLQGRHGARPAQPCVASGCLPPCPPAHFNLAQREALKRLLPGQACRWQPCCPCPSPHAAPTHPPALCCAVPGASRWWTRRGSTHASRAGSCWKRVGDRRRMWTGGQAWHACVGGRACDVCRRAERKGGGMGRGAKRGAGAESFHCLCRVGVGVGGEAVMRAVWDITQRRMGSSDE